MIPELCRIVLQVGAGIWIQSLMLITTGLVAGRLLHRFGPLAQAYVYKITLGCLAFSVALSLFAGAAIKPLYRISLPDHGATPVVSAADRRNSSLVASLASRVIPANPVADSDRSQATPAMETMATGAYPAISRTKPGANGQYSSASNTNSVASAVPMAGIRSIGPGTRPISSNASILRVLYIAFAGIWLAGAVWQLGILMISQISLWKLRRRSIPIVTGGIPELTEEHCAAHGQRMPYLRCSALIKSPFLMGVLHPTIMLPHAAVREPLSGETKAILVHELTHLSHNDCLTNICFRIASALLWPQPLLHLLFRHWARSAEDVCDRAVISSNCESVAYAQYLLHLADHWQPARKPDQILGMGMSTFHSNLGRRIQQILELSSAHLPQLSVRARTAIIAAAILVAVIAVRTISSAAAPHLLPHAQHHNAAIITTPPVNSPDTHGVRHLATKPTPSLNKGNPDMIKKSTAIASALLALAAGPFQVHLPAASAQFPPDAAQQLAAAKASADAASQAANTPQATPPTPAQQYPTMTSIGMAPAPSPSQAQRHPTLSALLAAGASPPATSDQTTRSASDMARGATSKADFMKAVANYNAGYAQAYRSARLEVFTAFGKTRIAAQDAPVREVLIKLFSGANLNYIIDPDVTGNVTMSLTDVSFNVALRALLRGSSTPLTYDIENGIYHIKNKLVTFADDVLPNKTVTLTLHDASLSEALDQLFKQANGSYALAPGHYGTVTLNLSAAGFGPALRAILAVANPPLTYEVQDGIVRVQPKTATLSDLKALHQAHR